MQYTEIQTKPGVLEVPVLDHEATSKLHLTWHWSAGSYRITGSLFERYHFIIDNQGNAHGGVPVEYNINTRNHSRRDGYARHVLNANSNNIGIAAASMGGAHEHEACKGCYGKWPMTPAQVTGMIEVAAHLCANYGIPVIPTRVLGHEEWDSIHGRPQDRWDVNCIPHLDIRPHLNNNGTYDSTNYLRSHVALRVMALKAHTDPELRSRQLTVFRHFIEFHDSAYAAEIPPVTLQAIKQLRQLPPFGSFTRDDLASTTTLGNIDDEERSGS